MRTISRSSTRQIAALRETLTRCHAYTLAGYFIAQPCDPSIAWSELGRYTFTRLADNGNGTYTIRITANHWYELSAGEATVSS